MHKILENIVHKLVYTCEEATYLLEKKASAQALSTLETIRLKSHLAICKFCRAYEKKVHAIDQAMIRISKKPVDILKDSEIAEFKKRLNQSF